MQALTHGMGGGGGVAKRFDSVCGDLPRGLKLVFWPQEGRIQYSQYDAMSAYFFADSETYFPDVTAMVELCATYTFSGVEELVSKELVVTSGTTCSGAGRRHQSCVALAELQARVPQETRLKYLRLQSCLPTTLYHHISGGRISSISALNNTTISLFAHNFFFHD
jgi:hypothetical protein